MSEPLTTEHFDETMRAIAETLGDHGRQLSAIADTLKDHTKRLERIEDHLWNEQRLEEIERRLLRLGELSGDAELATPLRRPIGS